MTNDNRVRKRDEISDDFKWKLEDLYETDEAWEAECRKLESLIQEMEALEGSLSSGGQAMLAYFQKKDQIDYYMGRVIVYANERYHQDTTVSKYQGYRDQAERLSVEASEACAFAGPEILNIPEDKLNKIMQQEPKLALYKRKTDEIMRARPHTLSEAEEKLLAKAGDILSGSSNVYHMFHDADLRFPSIRDVEGNRIQVTNGNFVMLLNNRDRSLRKQVFEGLYHSYARFGNTMAATYLNRIKADAFLADVSHYSGSRQMYLDYYNIPEQVYDNLIEAVHRHLPAFYEYVDLRKQLLNEDYLHMYDVYVPIVDTVERRYSFAEAKEIVLAALAPMGEEYCSILKEGFDHGWIDVYENENKRSGAYSWGAYGTHPYVLLNFQGDLDSVFTLAHEMGHAIHTYYSNSNQPITYSEYSIFVAEVASTCNESLLIKYMLEHTQDRKEKLFLINHYLEAFRGTVFRQTMFAEFEYQIHSRYENNEPVTQEIINSLYHDLVHLYFGDNIVIDEEIDYEWMRIPHFYSPYYVYQYATGYSAATAFSHKILTEKEPAVERYISQFLKGGCSADPIDLLRNAGVDMSSPEPVEEALGVFEKYLHLFKEQL